MIVVTEQRQKHGKIREGKDEKMTKTHQGCPRSSDDLLQPQLHGLLLDVLHPQCGNEVQIHDEKVLSTWLLVWKRISIILPFLAQGSCKRRLDQDNNGLTRYFSHFEVLQAHKG